MKTTRIIILIAVSMLFTWKSFTQTTNDILNLLIENKTITQLQADSIRAEAAIKQQEENEKKKSFFLNAARQMQISGYTQVRYQNQDEAGKIDGFDIRRARIEVRGNINPYWSYQFQTDFAVTPKLLDAVAEYKPYDFLIVSIGQTKIPFSLENQYSDNKAEFINRSQVVEALVARSKDVIGDQNGRDLGVQVGGSLFKCHDRFLFDYKIGVFNGNGINNYDLNESKDLSGRFILHPLKGFDIGGSYYYGWDVFGTPATEQHRNRYGFELSFERSRYSLKSEYIKGLDGKIDRDGFYIQGGYFIVSQKLQFLAKFDQYNPDISKANDISQNYTLALNYNINSFTRLQAAYTFRQEEKTQINNNLGAIQFQIGF